MANKTLLGYVQDLCRKQGLPIPSGVVSSTDETVVQIWGLLNEEVSELANRGEWNEMRKRVSFNHQNGADYSAYAIDDDSGAFVNYIVPETLWCSTTRIRVAGPLSPRAWNEMLNYAIQPATYSFRIYNGALRIYPVPTAVSTTFFSMEYVSSAPFMGSDGSDKEDCTADDDVCKLPTRIIEAGMRWRYKKEKGLPYAEDQRGYEEMLSDQLGGQDAQGVVKMDGYSSSARPMIIIPPGNWPVS